MKIRVTEETGIKHDGASYSFEDQCTVSDAVGEYFCSMGWAEDVDGKVASGTRSTTNVVIAPANVMHAHTGENAGG